MTRRRAPIRTHALKLEGDYEGWVVVVRTNPAWGTLEDLAETQDLSRVRAALEQIVVGPWNFVDENGDPVGEPFEGKPPDGEGPWSVPRPGCIRQLSVDLIEALARAYTELTTSTPNV